MSEAAGFGEKFIQSDTTKKIAIGLAGLIASVVVQRFAGAAWDKSFEPKPEDTPES